MNEPRVAQAAGDKSAPPPPPMPADRFQVVASVRAVEGGSIIEFVSIPPGGRPSVRTLVLEYYENGPEADHLLDVQKTILSLVTEFFEEVSL